MYLTTQKERIIPLVVVMIMYFWAWYVSINIPGTPVLFKQLLMGSFLAVCAVWIFNISFKISMHSTAMGGMLMFLLVLSLTDDYTSGLYISVAFLLSGLVTTARFIVSDHSKKDLYAGLIAGAVSQLIAWYWYHG